MNSDKEFVATTQYGRLMTINFTKTGVSINAFLGDTYRIEYVFSTLRNLPIAKLTYQNFSATIAFNDSNFEIRPATKVFFGDDYEIVEGESLIGQINDSTIKLLSGKAFEFKNRYNSFWERIFPDKCQQFQLQSIDELVSYKFVKEAKFDQAYGFEHYRELRGTIETTYDCLFTGIIGVFLIEKSLRDR